MSTFWNAAILFGLMAAFCVWVVWNGLREGFGRNRRNPAALNRLLPKRDARRMAWAQILGGLMGLAGSLFALHQFWLMAG